MATHQHITPASSSPTHQATEGRRPRQGRWPRRGSAAACRRFGQRLLRGACDTMNAITEEMLLGVLVGAGLTALSLSILRVLTA